MPASVKSRAVASAFWKRHAPLLISSRRLRPEHADTFGLLCHYAADIVDLMTAISETGTTETSERGTLMHPNVRALRDARRDYVSLARDFGLTSASDARIPDQGDHEEEADPKAAKFRAFIGARTA